MRRESYNDDVAIEHFQSSTRRYAGKRRRGVIDEHLERLSMSHRIDQALDSPFFLSLSTPLPKSRIKAALFIKEPNPSEIAELWTKQLSAVTELVQASQQTEQLWIGLIPSESKPSAGKVRLSPHPPSRSMRDRWGHLAPTIPVWIPTNWQTVAKKLIPNKA